MDLFSSDVPQNILPGDGEANYFGAILSSKEANWFMADLLQNADWKNDEAILFGKRIITKRKTAWYGDQPFSYTYSKVERKALPWIESLTELKKRVEEASGTTYNSCLLNLYHSGNEGMSWHSDDEPELLSEAPIASLSLGAERRFLFRHKTTKETVGTVLENGSLLVMKGSTQKNWLHSLPVSKKVTAPRINLTFRTINP